MGQRSDVKAVTIGTTATQILPLRAEREVALIFNASASIIYYKLGTGATVDLYTGRLQANELSPPIYKYTGPITAVRASGTSSAYVTECW